MKNLPDSKYDENGRPIKRKLKNKENEFSKIIFVLGLFLLIMYLFNIFVSSNPDYVASNFEIMEFAPLIFIILILFIFRSQIYHGLKKLEEQSQENMKNNDFNFDFRTFSTKPYKENDDDDKDKENIDEFMRQNSDLRGK